MKKILALLMSALILTSFASCGKDAATEAPETTVAPETAEGETAAEVETVAAEGLWKDAYFFADTTFGEGANTATVEVSAEGKVITFTVKTDKTIVGDALVEHNLISGEEGAYGLYIKYVNGMYADYDTDKSYWSFYINGDYAMTGVDSTEIKEGEIYKLEYVKE